MNNRESNYELLRILAGMAVVILHFNYHPSGGGALEGATGITYYVLMLLETLSICAVNVFILISGYFGCNSRKIRIERLIGLVAQTIFISLALNVVSCIRHNRFEIKQILGALIPANYFVILYVILMLVAPFINKLMDALSEKSLSILLTIVFFAFSVYSTCVDVLKEVTGSAWAGLSSIGLDGSMNGYQIVNFIMVYMIGAYLRKNESVKRFSAYTLAGALIGSVAVIMIWRRFLPMTAWTYNNPIIILEACFVFMLFGKIRLSSRWINMIAPASFTCYLLHGSILGVLNSRISSMGSLPSVLLMLAATVLGIYLVSIVVMYIWNILAKPIRHFLASRIPTIQVD